MNTDHRAGAAPLAALLLLIIGTTQAASPTTREHGMREHGAHEHGHGVLEVAMEGHDLHVELRIPGVNVVGFEHAASTDAQRDAVRRALATFRRGQDLFVTSDAARCALESAEAALGGERDHGHEHGHARKGHEEHGHGKEHEHGHAEKNDKEHGHDKQAHSDAELHSELHAAWRFHCDAPDKLERIEVKLFEHLLEVDEIDAQVVTATLQKATELRRGSATLDLGKR